MNTLRGERIKELFTRYTSNTITRTEMEELFGYIRDGRNDPQLQEEMDNVFRELSKKKHQDPEIDWDFMFRKAIGANASPMHVVTPGPWKRFRGLAAAAAVIGVILGSVWFYKNFINSASDTGGHQVAEQTIQPGNNKAFLTLADGSVITLDDAADGTLSQQGNTTVIKMSDALCYQGSSATEGEILYNTITTPRGGQYKLTLADGSIAWLNAASSLRFPTAFTASVREVEVSGEVYFEVAPDARRPFRATWHNGGVEVLGTAFNVNAYTDEPTVNTTLVDGSVRLFSESSDVILQPGQQGRYSQSGSGRIVVKKVNTTRETAWKNGFFEFYGSIESIMRQISRWYDVDVKYEGNTKDIEFAGAVPRSMDINSVLETLETTGTIRFEIKGKTIVVKT